MCGYLEKLQINGIIPKKKSKLVMTYAHYTLVHSVPIRAYGVYYFIIQTPYGHVFVSARLIGDFLIEFRL